MTHKSGQNMSAIGYYATFFRKKDVTTIMHAPNQLLLCHHHWLTRDATERKLAAIAISDEAGQGGNWQRRSTSRTYLAGDGINI